jgi:hypothetical protein
MGRSESGSAQARASPTKIPEIRKRGRPGRPLRSAPASAGALPWRARGAEPLSSFQEQKKRSSERASGAIRGSRDRFKGQPQERQHRAARRAGRGTDCPRRTTQEPTSRQVGTNFAFVISVWCACRYAACASSLISLFTEDHMAKKAKKAKKKTAKATKKVAKKTSKRKK